MVERYIDLARDEFWSQVLWRAIRMHLAANEPSPLDAVISIAMSALELLAWVHRDVAPPIKVTRKAAPAADSIRGLLDWASIPLIIPPELAHLQAYAKREQLRDLPAALAGVRNRLVHPPRARRKSEWPSPDVMIDAWRAAMECLDLCLLRVLGHQGTYAHRRHLDGRHVGELTPVPWVSTTS